jgi:parallel beta-helix repeat protein
VSKRAPHHSTRTLKAIAAATLAGAAIFASTLGAGSAAAAGECTAVASPQGSPSAPGTLAAPVRTAQQAIDIAGAGGVACLRAGSYSSEDQIRLEQPGTTLMSYPGERAALRGRVYVTKTGDGVTVANLDIDGRNENTQPSPTINGDDVTISGNDITNHHTGICIVIGSPDPQWGRAHDTLIEDNRIHDCGVLPAENFDHGVYVSAADRTVIRNNWIYDNADRGIQLYSDADHTTITGNVIDGNGQGVIFGGHEESSSDHNTVTNNVITNSKIRDNIESSFAPEQIGVGNLATDNCVGGGAYDEGDGGILAGPVAQVGFRAEDNLIGDPGYANRAAKDFSLDPQSACGRILAGAPAPAGTISTGATPDGSTDGSGDEPAPASDDDGGAETGDSQDSSGQPVSSGRVTIDVSRSKVVKHQRFTVHGAAVAGARVEIIRRVSGGWRRVAVVGASESGSYRAGVRARGNGRQILRARATGLAASDSVKVKVSKR